MVYDLFNNIRDNNIEKVYDVSDVSYGYNYWFWKLLNFCMTIFDYEGLPDSLPKREIESNLLLTGHDVVFEYKGDLITCNTCLYGIDLYFNPTSATFANPSIKEYIKLDIGRNCDIIYNSSLKDNVLYIYSDGSMLSFIRRYSRLLADVESTLDIHMINSRLTSYPVASTDNIMQNIKQFFKKVRAGKTAIITDDAIIQQFRSVDINRANIHDGINDWLVARDKILEMFFRDIGVKFYNPKKAQVSEDELQVNNQMLIISLDDMLQERKAGIDRINKMFGTNITVDISESFKLKEVSADEQDVQNIGLSE